MIMLAESVKISYHVLGYHDRHLCMPHCFFVSMQLRQQSTHLHVSFALILQFLKLFRWVSLKFLNEKGRVNSLQTSL